MNKLVKESEYFVAWFVFWLCGTVGGFIVGGIAGGIVGAILGAAGAETQTITWICAGVGFVISIPLSYVLFRVFVGLMIVKKAEARVATIATPSSNPWMSTDR